MAAALNAERRRTHVLPDPGCDVFVTKPCPPGRRVDKIRRLIRKTGVESAS
jgi:hypothetical protein